MNATLTARDWSNAMDAQSACNLGGVSRSLAEVIPKIRATLEAEGTPVNTTSVNQHPIVRLYAEQIIYLSGGGVGDSESYSKAYDIALNEMLRLSNRETEALQDDCN